MNNTTILDIDDVLDMDMDGVADLPDYVTPPAGLYGLSITEVKGEKYESKEKKQGLRIRVTHKIEEVVEVDEDSVPPAIGSLFSLTYQANEDGVAYLKQYAKKVLKVESFEGSKLRDVMEALDGAQFQARVTVREKGGYENVRVNPVA